MPANDPVRGTVVTSFRDRSRATARCAVSWDTFQSAAIASRLGSRSPWRISPLLICAAMPSATCLYGQFCRATGMPASLVGFLSQVLLYACS